MAQATLDSNVCTREFDNYILRIVKHKHWCTVCPTAIGIIPVTCFFQNLPDLMVVRPIRPLEYVAVRSSAFRSSQQLIGLIDDETISARPNCSHDFRCQFLDPEFECRELVTRLHSCELQNRSC